MLPVAVSNSTTISADMLTLQPAGPVKVVLTAPVTFIPQPGFPTEPQWTGTQSPGTPQSQIAQGTTLALLGNVSDALVAAGVAEYWS
jgi:hypothetical protein